MVGLHSVRLRRAGARWRCRARFALRIDLLLAANPLRLAKRFVRAARQYGGLLLYFRHHFENELRYLKWTRRHDRLTNHRRACIQAKLAARGEWPLISVVMPVYNPAPRFFDAAIWSVRRQVYPHWELCIADDASIDPEVRAVLDRHSAADKRIKIIWRSENGHIARATNSALTLAEGPFVAFLDHDDLIPPHALYWVAEEIVAHPDADILYSDSDHIDEDGWRTGPHFKTDFSPERLLGQNTISHLGVYRRALVERLGAMRVGFEGSQDYDLALRTAAASEASRIRHIPAILYHWRQTADGSSFSSAELDRCIAAARRAVEEHLSAAGVAADVVPAFGTTWQRIRYRLPDPAPKVSIIMPTRNRAALLRRATSGVLQETRYPSLELIVADNDSDEADALALLSELAGDPRVKVLRVPGPFNFSAINNAAAAASDGEVLVLLNNDVEITDPEWLEEMLSRVLQPGVGAVGAKLFYPDGRIQHAGVVLGMGGVAGHCFAGALGNHPGSPLGELFLARDVSAVTGACLAIKRRVFEEIGGFDQQNLPVAFNDVDLCLRLRERGYRIVWTPFAKLVHHESASRGSDLALGKQERFKAECAYMVQRWRDQLNYDPFYSPNLSLDSVAGKLATAPRVRRPWSA